MLELFTYGSTNGHKVAIALEELGLAYQVQPVDVFALFVGSRVAVSARLAA